MRCSKLLLAGWLWLAALVPAFAQAVVPVQMRNANLTTTSTQNLISTQNTFTAPRTLTLPGAGALSSYYIQFADTANAINGVNTLTIRMADGGLINGNPTLVLATAGTYVFIVPNGSGYYASVVTTAAGGQPGGTSGQVQYNNAGAFGGFTASGDFTINTATGVGTLTTVNANVGAFGSNVNCSSFTVNAKGLITAAAAVPCTPAVGSITGFGTGIATALAVNVGSAGAPILFNGAGGTPSSMVGTNITGLNATQLTTGTVPAAALPNPTTSALGGVQSLTCTANQWLNAISTSGVPACAQPAFSNLSGNLSAAQQTTALDGLTSCTTQGSILYRNATIWVCLTPGTSGQLLQTTGAGGNPSWITASGTGTVTSAQIIGAGLAVNSGTCTITSSGVCTVTVTAAVKADQTTATSTAVAVVPAIQQNHPSATKAWAYYTVSGIAYTQAAGYQINATLSRSGTGNVTVTFSPVFTSINYVCVVSSDSQNTVASGFPASASTFTIRLNDQTATAKDAGFNIICNGLQ